MGCGDISVFSGAEEAMVVPYINTDRYHGQDGFNDVSFEDKPDVKRVSQEKAWSVFSRISKVVFPALRGVSDVLTLTGSPGRNNPGGTGASHQPGHSSVG